MKARIKGFLMLLTLLLGMVLPMIGGIGVSAAEPTQNIILHKVDSSSNVHMVIDNDGTKTPGTGKTFLAGAKFQAFDVTELFVAVRKGTVIINNNAFPVKLEAGSGVEIPSTKAVHALVEAYLGQFQVGDIGTLNAALGARGLGNIISNVSWKTGPTVASPDDNTAFMNLPIGNSGEQKAYVIFEIESPVNAIGPAVPMVIALPMLDPADSSSLLSEVHIYPKNSISVPTKNLVIPDQKSTLGVSVGEFVDFDLTVKIPDEFDEIFRHTDGNDYFKYSYIDIIDTMQDGLAFYKWIGVNGQGFNLHEANEYSYEIIRNPPGTAFLANVRQGNSGVSKSSTLTIIFDYNLNNVVNLEDYAVPADPMIKVTPNETANRQKLVGTTLTVRIRTIVTDKFPGVGVPIVNEYHPVFRNGEGKFPDIPLGPAKESVQTYGYRFKKHDLADNTGLNGASFSIRPSSGLKHDFYGERTEVTANGSLSKPQWTSGIWTAGKWSAGNWSGGQWADKVFINGVWNGGDFAGPVVGQLIGGQPNLGPLISNPLWGTPRHKGDWPNANIAFVLVNSGDVIAHDSGGSEIKATEKYYRVATAAEVKADTSPDVPNVPGGAVKDVVTKLPADPTLAIAGLEVGEYIIYETVVPVGYLASSALTNGLKFIVYDYTWLDSDQPGEPAGLDVDDHHNLFNDKAGELPNTGGSGLWIVGAIVVAAFGAMFGFHFFNRKLQSKHEKHNDSI